MISCLRPRGYGYTWVGDVLDDALECEEGTRKAMVRVAKTKLMSRVTTHLDVAKNLLHREKGPAAAGRPSRSG